MGVLMLLATSLFLTFAYRAQLHDVRVAIYTRCLERAKYDEANNASVRADAELYQQLLDINDQAPVQTDPTIRALVDRQRAVIAEAQLRKQRAADGGTVGGCDALRP